jgi:hypothetical protein
VVIWKELIKETARKETHKAVIRNREIYRSSERGLEKIDDEKRQKSPAVVYQYSYQKTQRGDLNACPQGAFHVMLCSGKTKQKAKSEKRNSRVLRVV